MLQLQSTSVVVTIWNHTEGLTDELIGKTTVELGRKNTCNAPIWYPLQMISHGFETVSEHNQSIEEAPYSSSIKSLPSSRHSTPTFHRGKAGSTNGKLTDIV